MGNPLKLQFDPAREYNPLIEALALAQPVGGTSTYAEMAARQPPMTSQSTDTQQDSQLIQGLLDGQMTQQLLQRMAAAMFMQRIQRSTRIAQQFGSFNANSEIEGDQVPPMLPQVQTRSLSQPLALPWTSNANVPAEGGVQRGHSDTVNSRYSDNEWPSLNRHTVIIMDAPTERHDNLNGADNNDDEEEVDVDATVDFPMFRYTYQPSTTNNDASEQRNAEVVRAVRMSEFRRQIQQRRHTHSARDHQSANESMR